MNIVPKLNLNKHPKDIDNMSLVMAQNIMLSNDASCITNEQSVKKNTYISGFLDYEFNDFSYKIVGIIPCNNELVIFVAYIKNAALGYKVNIYRYREKTSSTEESIKLVYENLSYNNGRYIGTFTYNVENSLIISFCEIESNIDNPLSTLNLGNFDNDDITNDRVINKLLLPMCPEVRIPNIIDYNYVEGNAYKGWYFFFIRYKINDFDYTQWFNFGYPIYLDEIKQQEIINLTNHKNNDESQQAGIFDYFSEDYEICQKSIEININITETNYTHYQLGFICSSKIYTKSYKTFDIPLITNKYLVNYNSGCEEISVVDLLTEYENYYDVKNIINFKNNIYISNYKTKNISEDFSDIVSNIKMSINKRNITIDTFKDSYYSVIINNVGTFKFYKEDIDSNGNISFKTIFGWEESKKINIQGDNGAGYPFLPTELSQRLNYVFSGNCLFHILDENNAVNKIVIGHKDPKTGNIDYLEDTKNVIIAPFPCYNPDQYIITWYNQNIGTVNYVEDSSEAFNFNRNFYNRLYDRSLIPGEIYNFFIHFVDKYGNYTNGYRIDNNIIYHWTNNWQDESTYVYNVYPFAIKDTNIKGCIPIDENIITNGSINFNAIKFFTSSGQTSLADYRLIGNYITQEDIEDCRKKLTEMLRNFTKGSYKAYEILFSEPNSWDYFPVFINNNGDRLFRVPSTTDGLSYTIYTPSINHVQIPDGYVGYFISYEKLESTKKYTGLLTNNNFNIEDTEVDNNYMYFYTSNLDIDEKIYLNLNILKIEGIDVFYEHNSSLLPYKPNSFHNEWNMPQYLNNDNEENDINNIIYSINDVELCVANDYSKNRKNRETCIKLPIITELFNEPILYKATVYNINRNIYMSNNKTLIRCSDYIYEDNSYYNIKHYANGIYSINSFLNYYHNGVQWKTINILGDNNWNSLMDLSDDDFKPIVKYLQIPQYSNVVMESKVFNNKPEKRIIIGGLDETPSENTDTYKHYITSFVLPQDSIDLFKNNQSSIDELCPKTYTNYKQNNSFISEFNKTLRRSNIIQDESKENAWRRFSLEDYKFISENKGNITNIVGLGNIILVHTEHSLFMFDGNNVLKTQDKEVQLGSQDIFDIDYKEVFTTKLGFGGLKDNRSSIIDTFGYIFYDEDSHRFYQFDNGQLANIDLDAINYFDKIKPTNVRFAYDKENNRILIKYDYNDTSNVISYNLLSKSFISLHSYRFEKAFNTKNNLYLLNSDTNGNHTINEFIRDDSSFMSFNNNTEISYMDIVVNVQYKDIKFINYITYKLRKLTSDFTILPVEGIVEPYSADIIKIYNDQCDTGDLDVAISSEDAKNPFGNFDKPYWHLGNWNFSYIRDKISQYGSDANHNAFMLSRLFGNYFIIRFVFNNEDNRKVEFEQLDCNLSLE